MDSSEMDYYMEDVPHKVAQLRANELGLYDMTGNVQEWCNDWADDAPGPKQVTDPVGSAAGSEKWCVVVIVTPHGMEVPKPSIPVMCSTVRLMTLVQPVPVSE